MNACPTFGPDGNGLPTDLGRGLVSYAGDERARRTRPRFFTVRAHREHLVCGCSLGVRGSSYDIHTDFSASSPSFQKIVHCLSANWGPFLTPYPHSVRTSHMENPRPRAARNLHTERTMDADAPHTLLPRSETSVA